MVEWLADVLAQAGLRVHGRLSSVSSEAVGAGSGAFGQLVRLHLTYKERRRTDPTSLILKAPSRSASNRSRAEAFDMYARELHFYSDIAPRLRVRVPRCYYSGLDTDGRLVLLLEDLGHLRVGDQVAGLRAGHAAAAVSALAAAHAQWWEAEELAGLDWLPSFDSAVMLRLVDVYRRQWPGFVELHRGHLPAAAIALGQRLLHSVDSIMRTLSEPPVTLVHGDFRADNLFFGRPSLEDRTAVVDWQLACRARGAFDVAHLLCQSVNSNDRAHCEWTVLRRWHEAVTGRGVDNYSFADAAQDYRRGALLCVAYSVAGAVLDRSNERGVALARIQAERTFRAALDLGAGELLVASGSSL